MYNLNEEVNLKFNPKTSSYEAPEPEPEQGWFSSALETLIDLVVGFVTLIVRFCLGCLSVVWALLVLAVAAVFTLWPLWLFIIMCVLLYKWF